MSHLSRLKGLFSSILSASSKSSKISKAYSGSLNNKQLTTSKKQKLDWKFQNLAYSGHAARVGRLLMKHPEFEPDWTQLAGACSVLNEKDSRDLYEAVRPYMNVDEVAESFFQAYYNNKMLDIDLFYFVSYLKLDDYAIELARIILSESDYYFYSRTSQLLKKLQATFPHILTFERLREIESGVAL